MHRTVPSTIKQRNPSWNQLAENCQSESYVISFYVHKYLITNKPKLERGCQIGLAINHHISVLSCQCIFKIPGFPCNRFPSKCQVPSPLSFVRSMNLILKTYLHWQSSPLVGQHCTRELAQARQPDPRILCLQERKFSGAE